MKILVRSLLFFAAVCSAGCAAHQNSVPHPVPQQPSTVIVGAGVLLERGHTVYIPQVAVSENNQRGAAAFGTEVAETFRLALAPYSSSVTVGREVLTRVPALDEARKMKARYLVIPSVYQADILTYEQAPEARMVLFYSVFEAATGQQLLMRRVRVTTGSSGVGAAPAVLRDSLASEMNAIFQSGIR
jgi:hypothetical protein